MKFSNLFTAIPCSGVVFVLRTFPITNPVEESCCHSWWISFGLHWFLL